VNFCVGELEWQIFHALLLRAALRWDSVVELTVLDGRLTLYSHGTWRKQLMEYVVRGLSPSLASCTVTFVNPVHAQSASGGGGGGGGSPPVHTPATDDLLVRVPVTFANAALPVDFLTAKLYTYTLPAEVLGELKEQGDVITARNELDELGELTGTGFPLCSCLLREPFILTDTCGRGSSLA
jgi:hypothetical protein